MHKNWLSRYLRYAICLHDKYATRLNARPYLLLGYVLRPLAAIDTTVQLQHRYLKWLNDSYRFFKLATLFVKSESNPRLQSFAVRSPWTAAQEFMSDPNNTNNESANAIMNATLDVAQAFENSLSEI